MSEELRDKIREILTSNLGDSYFCTRVWSAWSHDTMTEDDFETVNESENIDDIVTELNQLINIPKHETVEHEHYSIFPAHNRGYGEDMIRCIPCDNSGIKGDSKYCSYCGGKFVKE